MRQGRISNQLRKIHAGHIQGPSFSPRKNFSLPISCGLYLLGITHAVALVSSLGLQTAMAQSSETSPPEAEATVPYLRPPTSCPSDVAILVSGLIRDLPGYANRVAYRSLAVNENETGFGTLLVAGQAELDPLDISTLTFLDDATTPPEAIQQVFFTTLEWHYTETDYIPLEQYHWLFLTEAADGWRLALMFSRAANDDVVGRPPTPPQESSNGIVGQAVQLWLRDCRAGAVYPIDSSDAVVTGP